MPEPGSSSALRIALLTHSVHPRGGVVHTLELARALHGLGHAVTVFAPARQGQRMFREVPCAVELVPVGPAPKNLADSVGERIGAFVVHLSRYLQDERFDVFHAHDGIGGNGLATLCERGFIDAFVRTVHHLDAFDDPRLAAWQDRAVLAATQVLCVSDTWRERLGLAYGIEAARVHNGVDLDRFRPAQDAGDAGVASRLGLNPGTPRVLSVGGIEERKNSVRLLEAFLDLRRSHPQAQLVIAGGASLLDHGAHVGRFDALVRGAGLRTGPGQPIVLTGPLLDEEMPALFRLADVLAMPSLCEGFGLVVLEALACGTPVVVSAIAPFTEYLGETVAAGHAAYCDPESAASIAQALHGALDGSHPRSPGTATPPVCLRFDWRASAARHVALYQAGRAPARTPCMQATATLT